MNKNIKKQSNRFCMKPKDELKKGTFQIPTDNEDIEQENRKIYRTDF